MLLTSSMQHLGHWYWCQQGLLQCTLISAAMMHVNILQTLPVDTKNNSQKQAIAVHIGPDIYVEWWWHTNPSILANCCDGHYLALAALCQIFDKS